MTPEESVQILRRQNADLANQVIDWRRVADQLADTLLRNGVGGAGFNAAIDAYRAAVASEMKAGGEYQ